MPNKYFLSFSFFQNEEIYICNKRENEERYLCNKTSRIESRSGSNSADITTTSLNISPQSNGNSRQQDYLEKYLEKLTGQPSTPSPDHSEKSVSSRLEDTSSSTLTSSKKSERELNFELTSQDRDFHESDPVVRFKKRKPNSKFEEVNSKIRVQTEELGMLKTGRFEALRRTGTNIAVQDMSQSWSNNTPHPHSDVSI